MGPLEGVSHGIKSSNMESSYFNLMDDGSHGTVSRAARSRGECPLVVSFDQKKVLADAERVNMESDSIFIVTVLASVLSRLIDINLGQPPRTRAVRGAELFESSTLPPISIATYLARIQRYAKCSDACFVVALIYIDRLIELRNVVLTSLNVHRIVITSVLLATKTMDDVCFPNSYFARLGGIPPQEMNTLESEFLILVNYSLFVLPESYDKYLVELKSFSVDVHSSKPCQSVSSREEEEEKQHLDMIVPVHLSYSLFSQDSPMHQVKAVPRQWRKCLNDECIDSSYSSNSYFSNDVVIPNRRPIPNRSLMKPDMQQQQPSSVTHSTNMSPSNCAYLSSYYSSNNCYEGVSSTAATTANSHNPHHIDYGKQIKQSKQFPRANHVIPMENPIDFYFSERHASQLFKVSILEFVYN